MGKVTFLVDWMGREEGRKEKGRGIVPSISVWVVRSRLGANSQKRAVGIKKIGNRYVDTPLYYFNTPRNAIS